MSDYEYELRVPFLCTHTAGGPYDDDAFVAGFALGQFFQDLKHANGLAVDGTFPAETLETLDLLAMQQGYELVLTPETDGWVYVNAVIRRRDDLLGENQT